MDWLVGNSLGVRRELAKGIGSLPGWRKGVHRRKTETHRKIIGELQIRHGPKIKLRHQTKDWTIRWELARSSPKVSGRSLGTCWEITGEGPWDSPQGMLEVARLWE
ncbi:hypothetical protein BHE74_00056511 [Ensete ventricosum]|nr:hypothetical protein BHE74_00056511 [Ensete ventricosum]